MSGSMHQHGPSEPQQYGYYVVEHRDGSSELFISFDNEPVMLENVGVSLKFFGSHRACRRLDEPLENYFAIFWRRALEAARPESNKGRLLVIAFVPDHAGLTKVIRRSWEQLTETLGYIPTVFVNAHKPPTA